MPQMELSTMRLNQTHEQSRLLAHYAESAVRLAYHITRDREVALDLSQDAMLKALERLNELRDPGALKSWFNRILVHACRDWLRRRGLEARGREKMNFEKSVRTAWKDPYEAAEHQESLERVRWALLNLPLEYREALALVFVEGVSSREAAEILEIPEGTLRWRTHEGKRLLKAFLNPESGTEK